VHYRKIGTTKSLSLSKTKLWYCNEINLYVYLNIHTNIQLYKQMNKNAYIFVNPNSNKDVDRIVAQLKKADNNYIHINYANAPNTTKYKIKYCVSLFKLIVSNTHVTTIILLNHHNELEFCNEIVNIIRQNTVNFNIMFIECDENNEKFEQMNYDKINLKYVELMFPSDLVKQTPQSKMSCNVNVLDYEIMYDDFKHDVINTQIDKPLSYDDLHMNDFRLLSNQQNPYIMSENIDTMYKYINKYNKHPVTQITFDDIDIRRVIYHYESYNLKKSSIYKISDNEIDFFFNYAFVVFQQEHLNKNLQLKFSCCLNISRCIKYFEKKIFPDVSLRKPINREIAAMHCNKNMPIIVRNTTIHTQPYIDNETKTIDNTIKMAPFAVTVYDYTSQYLVSHHSYVHIYGKGIYKNTNKLYLARNSCLPANPFDFINSLDKPAITYVCLYELFKELLNGFSKQ